MQSTTPDPAQKSDSTPGAHSIAGRILQIRQMQTELRQRPVTGKLRAIKKFFYKAVRSTFWRQFNINQATIELVEAVHRELVEYSYYSQQTAANPAEAPKGITIFSGEMMASCGQSQGQMKLNNVRPLDGFNAVYTAPAEMRMTERVALYSLIFGMQPRNCLEIGTFRGGSSAIICGAMDDTGFGQLACVDPIPRITPALWSKLSNRCRLFEGTSPGILADVARQISEPFDFVLLDGEHAYEGVKRDTAAILQYLADNAYLLYHDANNQDVRRAIDESVAEFGEISDCGLMSVEPTVLHQDGQTVTWAGLRLLRFQRRAAKAKAA